MSARKRFGRRALRGGAHDVTTGFAVDDEGLYGLAQALPLGLVLDAGRHADALSEGHENQVTGRDSYEGREPRALGAERILEHLHQDVRTLAHQLADVVGARRGAAVLRVVGLDDVRGVQKRRALEADIDERRLHAR